MIIDFGVNKPNDVQIGLNRLIYNYHIMKNAYTVIMGTKMDSVIILKKGNNDDIHVVIGMNVKDISYAFLTFHKMKRTTDGISESLSEMIKTLSSGIVGNHMYAAITDNLEDLGPDIVQFYGKMGVPTKHFDDEYGLLNYALNNIDDFDNMRSTYRKSQDTVFFRRLKEASLKAGLIKHVFSIE